MGRRIVNVLIVPGVRRAAVGLAAGCLVFGVARAAAQQPAPAQSGPAAPPIVSVMSGPSGETRDGRFYILAPRTRFRVPDDAAIVVYFEWAAKPGDYTLTGTWRGPGGVSSSNEFRHSIRDRRLAAYWQLPLSATMPTGDWSIEARIDGVVAGTHEFQIVGPEAAPIAAAPARRLPLERREAFARTLSLTAKVEAFGDDGSRLDAGPGTLLEGRTVAASFAVINNATRLRVTLPGAAPVELSDVAAFNHRQGWVLLELPGGDAPREGVVARESAQAGDACYSVSASKEGTLAVQAGEVVGTGTHPLGGGRLYATCAPGTTSAGAPVVNEFGDVIGMIASGSMPGIREYAALEVSDLSTLRVPVIPAGILHTPAARGPVTPLATIAQRGLFVPPVTMERQVVSAGFATRIVRDGPATRPLDQRYEFSRRDPAVATFVNWLAVDRFKGTASLRVYDIDNQVTAQSTPVKLTLRKGDLKMTSWELPTPGPGIYRVDILLGADVAWRGHLRVVE
ncbi:MAG: hypothetical protein JNM38_12605 [Acidobacteria bacterium]|nr:hypothetical protein [Acidobacteriota bacterium]